MLVFGRISKVNKNDYTVKMKLPDYDDFETTWLIIPQIWVKNNKSGYLPEINSLCAAILTDDMSEGVLLGAKYTDEDKIIVDFQDKEYICFSDGVTISHTPDSNQLYIKADTIFCDSNIVCTKDISDKNGTMQSIRDWGNSHSHTDGNNGANTGSPTSTI